MKKAIEEVFENLFKKDKKKLTREGIVCILLGIITVVSLGLLTENTPLQDNVYFNLGVIVIITILFLIGFIYISVGTGNIWKADEREMDINNKANSNAWLFMFAAMTLWFGYLEFPRNENLLINMSGKQIAVLFYPAVVFFIAWFINVFSRRSIKKDK